MTTVKEYVEYLARKPIAELLDASGLTALHRAADFYGPAEAAQCGLEIVLHRTARQADFSYCTTVSHNGVPEERWYELDYACCLQQNITPCLFFDARRLQSAGECSAFLDRIRSADFPESEIGKIEPVLIDCLHHLSGLTRGLFQLGLMHSRVSSGPLSSLRVVTMDMTGEGALQYLHRMAWNQDREGLAKCLSLFGPFARRGLFHIDFDISGRGISRKIGINFYVRKDRESQEALLDFLVQRQLCLPEKKEGILQWISRLPQGDPFIANDWCHVKLPFTGGWPQTAKAYLRSSALFYERSEVFERPCLVNLELTDRCPLHCPQCYCDLQNARDMPLDTAIRSLRDARAAGVKRAYLSGGETLLYPHLREVVREAAGQGLQVHLATSGLGLDGKEWEDLRNAGVTEIYISLNGSTPEVDGQTRNGFELAIRALALLKESHHPGTHINWVMHRRNCHDFANMIALAESYAVTRLVILQRKPDSRNRLDDLPTYDQMTAVRDLIWNYQRLAGEGDRPGRVHISVEPCYSPMKALLEQRFLGNRNGGVYQGCLAGRAVYSVSLDGTLTPCRHLVGPEWSARLVAVSGGPAGREPGREEFGSVEEFWQKSEALQRLRRDDDRKASPCADCRFACFCRPCVAMKKAMGDTRRCAVHEA